MLSNAYTEGGNLIPYVSSMNTSTGSHSSLTRHVWSDHSLSVTDIHCGSGGLRCRVATASLDQTCKVRLFLIVLPMCIVQSYIIWKVISWCANFVISWSTRQS